MDYDVSSAAFLVPRMGEHFSHSLSSIRDNFNFDESNSNTGHSVCSPLFQSIDEGLPTDLITFHHQEEVVATNKPQNTTYLPLNDLDSIDKSDLFSFDDDFNSSLPVRTPLDGQNSDDLGLVFGPKVGATSAPFTPLSADFTIPSELIDLIDEQLAEASPVQNSDNTSSSSDPPAWNKFNESTSPYISDPEREDLYPSEDEEFIERLPPQRKSRRKNSQANPPVCLHNEDLARGKPGQRLILTSEEKRLLVQMGQRVPTTFPLSRSEERAIRTMRRKIRNKLSAKASRARRQEYLSSLESRVADCHEENQRLRTRIRELEDDNAGLMASLRNMRSCMNRLIKGTCTATANGFGLKSDSASPLQPLLPLTVPRQGSNANQTRLKMKSGKPASLLLVALMILASATVLPLPGLENHSDTTAAVLKNDVSSEGQSVLSGRSRLLLNQEDEVDVKMHVKDEPPMTPALIGSSVEDADDDIPVIKTKIRVLNRSAERLLVPNFREEEQLDPFLLPVSAEMVKGKSETIKKGSDLEIHQKMPPFPYSLEDL
ncbi:hypothetical protein Aperf_G00000025987 [Anoplocephala perfoliata]